MTTNEAMTAGCYPVALIVSERPQLTVDGTVIAFTPGLPLADLKKTARVFRDAGMDVKLEWSHHETTEILDADAYEVALQDVGAGVVEWTEPLVEEIRELGRIEFTP